MIETGDTVSSQFTAQQLRMTTMRISQKAFDIFSVIFGLVLTAAVTYHMASNPRWAGDNGPGVGKLPREIVQGFMHTSYAEGKAAEATALYMTAKTKDQGVPEAQRQDGLQAQQHVQRLLAEGLQVVVWHCLDFADGSSETAVDYFKTRDGRIQERVRALSQPLPAGERCAAQQA